MSPTADRVWRRFLASELRISPELEHSIDVVANYFKGSKRTKFLASIGVFRESIEQKSWIPRGKIKSNSGFYQGLSKNKVGPLENEEPRESYLSTNYHAEACIQYGQPYKGRVIPTVAGVPDVVVSAWIHCCNEMKLLSDKLDQLRPPPKVTAIGLSPKVTKTLIEMNLEIDLPSIKPAKIVTKYRQKVDDKTFKPMFDQQNKPVMEPYEVVEWSPGIKLHQSRFDVSDGVCEACGKRIPSGIYVPIEARCQKVGLVGLWLGVDCAKNIFGVKDQGVNLSDQT